MEGEWEVHTIEDHTTIVHERGDEKDILPFLSRLRMQVRETGRREGRKEGRVRQKEKTGMNEREKKVVRDSSLKRSKTGM